MENIITNLTIDLDCAEGIQTIRARKGDTARTLRVTLFDNAQKYPLTRECTAAIVAKKTDGKVICNDCTIVDGAIEYRFTSQTTSCEGTVELQLRVYGRDGAMIVATPIALEVIPSVAEPEEAGPVRDEMTALDALVSKTQQALTDVDRLLQSDALRGESAYDIAVRLGYSGTEQQWLESLRYDHSEQFAALAEQVRQSVAAAEAAQAQSAAQAAAAAQSAEEAAGSARSAAEADRTAADSAEAAQGLADQASQSARSAEAQASRAVTQANKAEAAANTAKAKAGEAATAAGMAKQEADRSAAAAARSVSHGITGAKPGDLFRITQVDGKGVPTALEPVSPDALESQWEVIKAVTVQEQVASLVLALPSLKGIQVLMKTLPQPGYQGGDYGLIYAYYTTAKLFVPNFCHNAISSKNYCFVAYGRFQKDGGMWTNTPTHYSQVDIDYPENPMAMSAPPGQDYKSRLTNDESYVTSIQLRCYDSTYIPKDSVITVLGVRA